MSDYAKVKIFLFDLGNVFFYVDLGKLYQASSKLLQIDSKKLITKCASLFDQFECGKIAETDFFQTLIKQCDLEPNPTLLEQMKTTWNDIFLGLVPETVAFIKHLRNLGCFKIAGFTNTNETHAKAWRKLYANELKLFDTIYSSELIGMRKPELEAFNYILTKEEVRPEEVVFFDDLAENVAAAKNIGINGIVFSVEALKEVQNGLQ